MLNSRESVKVAIIGGGQHNVTVIEADLIDEAGDIYWHHLATGARSQTDVSLRSDVV